MFIISSKIISCMFLPASNFVSPSLVSKPLELRPVQLRESFIPHSLFFLMRLFISHMEGTQLLAPGPKEALLFLPSGRGAEGNKRVHLLGQETLKAGCFPGARVVKSTSFRSAPLPTLPHPKQG